METDTQANDPDEGMFVPGWSNPDVPIYVPPGMMHLDEKNFMAAAADHRGEPRNLFPYLVAITALTVIIVLCII